MRLIILWKRKNQIMKKFKNFIVISIVFLFLIFPIKHTYKDGGTVTYTSLTYKIIRWKIPINIEIIDYNDENINQLQTKSFITKKNHINRKFFETTELYLFPCNFMKIDWYKERLETY